MTTPASPEPNPEPSRRLFIGLMVDAQVRAAVLAWRERWLWPRGAAKSSPAHLHLTLHFLGDTPESRLAPLQQALSAVTFKPFWLRLGQPETWPRGLVVLRPQPQPLVDALHQRVLQGAVAAGLAAADEGMPWKPHITLARRAAGAQPPPDALEIDWRITAFSLVWSRLPPQVPRAQYDEIGRWSAQPGGAGLLTI